VSQVRAFLSTPKGYTLAALLVLTAIGSSQPEAYKGWINTAAAVGAAVLVDLGFAQLQQRRNIVFPDGAVLTGLIVALVLSTMVPWYLCAFTAAIAILSKHLLKVQRRPVFNPAAFGLVVTILAFSTAQSWWGGLSMLPAWCIAFLVIAGMLVTARVNKFPAVFAYLGVYFSLLLVAGLFHISGAGEALRAPFLHSVLFLSFMMVTDPPTSPARYMDQVWFGTLAAAICVMVYLLVGGLYFYLLGLLVANAWNAWRSFSAQAARQNHV